MGDQHRKRDHSNDISIELDVSPSTFAKEAFLYAQKVGYLEADISHGDYPIVDFDAFLILYVVDGTGILQYENSSYPLEDGNIVFIDCKKDHKLNTTEKFGWHLLYLYFNGKQARSYYNMMSQHMVPICKLDDSKITNALLWNIFELHNSHDVFAERLTSLHVTRILTDISMYIDNQMILPVEYPEYVNSIFNHINHYYYQKISLDILAKKWSISKFHLARLFKQYSGMTINEFLITTRINKAKELLRHTDKTIDMIAEEVGFNSSSYFIYSFRKKEHVTPYFYRKQWNR